MADLRERWLAGEDVPYDPCLEAALDAMHNLIGRSDIEDRARFCLLTDQQRGRLVLCTLLALRDAISAGCAVADFEIQTLHVALDLYGREAEAR